MYPARSSYRSLNLPEELSLINTQPFTSNDSGNKMTAPTELLAQFLRTIMQKDYKNALIFCKLVQQFEPTNATAKAFYPMILKKVKQKSKEPEESSEEDDEDDEFPDILDKNDSGIDAKTQDSSDETSSEESENDQDQVEQMAKTLNIIEAQREIIKRIREKVVPPKENVVATGKSNKKIKKTQLKKK